MEDELHFLALSIGTFILVFIMLLACVRSCSKITENSVLASMEPNVRAQYLARGPNPRRYRRWLSPWTEPSQLATTNNRTNNHNPGIFVISTMQLTPTNASYDVMTTPSLYDLEAGFGTLPSYEEAMRQNPNHNNELPSYHQCIINENKQQQTEENQQKEIEEETKLKMSSSPPPS